jgi:hypothetical protein
MVEQPVNSRLCVLIAHQIVEQGVSIKKRPNRFDKERSGWSRDNQLNSLLSCRFLMVDCA